MTIFVFIGSDDTPGAEGDFLNFTTYMKNNNIKKNSIAFYNKKDQTKSNDEFLKEFASITSLLQNDTTNKITHSTIIIFISAHGSQSCSLASPQFYLPNNRDGINISELINRVQNYNSIYLFMDTCRVTTRNNIIPSQFNVTNKNLMIVYGTQQLERSRGRGYCGGLFLSNVFNKMSYNNLFNLHVSEASMISLLIDIFTNWSIDQWVACNELYGHHINPRRMEEFKSQKPDFQMNSTLRNKYMRIVELLASIIGKNVRDVSATRINTSIEDKRIIRALLDKTNSDLKELQSKITIIQTQLGTTSITPEDALIRYNTYMGFVKTLNEVEKKYKKILKSITNEEEKNPLIKSMREVIAKKIDNRRTAKKFNELYIMLKNYEELQSKKIYLEKSLL